MFEFIGVRCFHGLLMKNAHAITIMLNISSCIMVLLLLFIRILFLKRV